MLYTHIIVEGTVKEVIEFIKGTHQLNSEGRYVFSLNKCIPTPVTPDGDIIDGWYDWRVENWGVRDECDVHSECYTCIKGETKEYNDLTWLDYDRFIEFEKRANDYDIMEGLCTISNAVSLPLKALDKIAEMYKDTDLKITVKYHVASECIVGAIKYFKGEVTESEEFTCDEHGPEYYEYLLNEGYETTDSLMNDIEFTVKDSLTDMYDEDFVNRLLKKLTEQMYSDCTNAEKAKLYYDICIDEE